MFSNFRKKYKIYWFFSRHKSNTFILFKPYLNYIKYKNREYYEPIIYAIKFGVYILYFQFDFYIKCNLIKRKGQDKQRF